MVLLGIRIYIKAVIVQDGPDKAHGAVIRKSLFKYSIWFQGCHTALLYVCDGLACRVFRPGCYVFFCLAEIWLKGPAT